MEIIYLHLRKKNLIHLGLMKMERRIRQTLKIDLIEIDKKQEMLILLELTATTIYLQLIDQQENSQIKKLKIAQKNFQ